MTSAESRLAAASNEIRVRVESSKKRLTTVRPRRAGSFLIGRSASDRISSAVASTSSASSRVRSAADRRCFFDAPAPSMITASSSSTPVRWTRSRWTSEVGRFLPTKSAQDRQLAVPAVDECRRAARPRGRPTSLRASRAARMVRPENSTSSTSTTTLSSMPPSGIWVGSRVRAGLRRRSSRYIVTSREPLETASPSTAAIRSAIRSASGTPRDGMPRSTRSSAPLLRSRISWAMRLRSRAMSPESSTVRPSSGRPSSRRPSSRRPSSRRPFSGPGAGCAAGAGIRVPEHSFSASLDGSLKDVDRGDSISPGAALNRGGPYSFRRACFRLLPRALRPRPQDGRLDDRHSSL